MVKVRSMGRKQVYARKRVPSPWSDLNDDMLYSVMMRLGVVEYVSFSGVCKRWRSVAVSNRKTFMSSRAPMILCYEKTDCYLQDFEGRQFKTSIPELVGRECIGLTCGYLILFGEETRDFLLVNPITRHQLHFPDFPDADDVEQKKTEFRRAILVFSPSINGWVFAVLHKYDDRIWFSVVGKGKGAWNYVTSTSRMIELHAFKGKIYTLNNNSLRSREHKQVCEMRLDPVGPTTLVPILTLPDALFVRPLLVFDFISSDENLYLMEYVPVPRAVTYKVHKLDFDQLSCVPCEKTTQEYTFFNSHFKISAAVKSEAWNASSSPYCEQRFPHTQSDTRGKGSLYVAERWYFPHDCFDINLIK